MLAIDGLNLTLRHICMHTSGLCTFRVSPRCEVCSESQRAADFGRLKLPEGIMARLSHSSSLPLLTVIFCSKKEKQGGSASSDLMGCGIAICRGQHLRTYKWWRGREKERWPGGGGCGGVWGRVWGGGLHSCEGPHSSLLLFKKEHVIAKFANVFCISAMCKTTKTLMILATCQLQYCFAKDNFFPTVCS